MTLTHSADCHDPVCPETHEEQQQSGLDVERLAVAMNDAQIAPAEIQLGRDLRIPAHRVAQKYDAAAPSPAIDAELLGRAIREHRQAEFDPHAVISMTHLCFDDCAENIAARYDELAAR